MGGPRRFVLSLIQIALSLALTGALLGCDPPAPAAPPCPVVPPPPAPVAVGEVALDMDGLGMAAELPVPQGAATLLVRVDPVQDAAGCVQLHDLRDATNTPWVTPPASPADRGAYCQSCPQRVSVGVGGGTYVLPSSVPFPASLPGPFQVRAALRDCPTFLSAHPPSTERLRIRAIGLPAAPTAQRGRLPLALFFSKASAFFDPAGRAALDAALELLDQSLLPAGLGIRVVSAAAIDAEPGEPLHFSPGEHRALDTVAAQGFATAGVCAAPDAGLIPIYFVGCLVLDEPIFSRRAEPEGYTTGLPGGLPAPGHADGIFVRGRSCGGAVLEWPADLLAKLLLHELGHYLGLYHAVEADGARDPLGDTGPDNIMYFRPLTAAARGFSANQIQVMRRHPLIRWGW